MTVINVCLLLLSAVLAVLLGSCAYSEHFWKKAYCDLARKVDLKSTDTRDWNALVMEQTFSALEPDYAYLRRVGGDRFVFVGKGEVKIQHPVPADVPGPEDGQNLMRAIFEARDELCREYYGFDPSDK